MSAAPSGIVVEDLTFRYAGRKRPALAHLSFAVDPGETLLVLGPSGCGKSTLALCLNGLIPHAVSGEQQGRVTVDGREVRETSVADLARTVGLVFQDPDSQFCMLRVDDEIAFGLENLRTSPSEMPARIDAALMAVGLAGRERTRIDRLSGGARQRLALATVLAMEPRLLVFDEPTSNLDPTGADDVFAQIAQLKAAGDRTIVIVEHRLERLAEVVDRVLILGHEGELVAHGEPARVFRDHAAALEALGIWLPGACELANRLAAVGRPLRPYPLTADQAAAAIAESAGLGGSERDSTTCAERAPEQVAAPAVAIEHLSWAYPGGAVALRDMSLVVPEGSFFAIVGPNGAGKSTLASHLIGSLRAAWGAVRLFGSDVRDLDGPELTRLVGYVFQNPEHQFVAGTVYDELAFGLRLRQLPEAEVADRVEAMLEQFGLTALARANPFTLSHGEKRRLSVAAMLILGQRLLVLDEPTFGQDRRNADALLATLVELNRAGRTIVIITHDVRLVAEYAVEAAVLVEGRLEFQGSPEALFQDWTLLERARLVEPPALQLSHALRQCDPSFPELLRMDELAATLARRTQHLVGWSPGQEAWR